jgi:8-oxo-dGTP diphosphatase
VSWAHCTLGHAHWGRRGAGGLLLASGGRVLLQLRAAWAHQGGTWSIPGGARERGESYVDAALREAREEMGITAAEVQVVSSSAAVCGGWTYTTVLASPAGPLSLRLNEESTESAWVAVAEVSELALHPGFRTAWEAPDRALVDFASA